VLYRPVWRYVLLDGTPYRLVEGTAGDGLLLRAPAASDYPAPFNIAPGANTIAVAKGDPEPTSGTPITFSFYSEPIGGSGS
jgi:hypothetical protein